jgi:hypothetical protein
LFILSSWHVSGLSLHLGNEGLRARQQPDAVERNNHRVIKVPDDADGGVDSRPNQGAVNDKLAYGDLASPRWTSSGPVGGSARTRSYTAIWTVPSTSLVRL